MKIRYTIKQVHFKKVKSIKEIKPGSIVRCNKYKDWCSEIRDNGMNPLTVVSIINHPFIKKAKEIEFKEFHTKIPVNYHEAGDWSIKVEK